MARRRFEVDEQGQEDLVEEVRRLNARVREIEKESAERSGTHPAGPVVRVIARRLRRRKSEP